MKSKRTEDTGDLAGEFTVSPYNDMVYSGQQPLKGVQIFDTTLRDGEQTPGVALTPEDKVRIAQALDILGVSYIEAGFAGSSDIEKQTIRRINDLGLSAKVLSLARSVTKDIDAAIDSGCDSVHTFIATSDLHMKYKLKMTPEEVRLRAVEAIEYAREHGLQVHFSCEDATRTELGFLREMYLAAQDAGASSVNIADTVGVILPKAMAYLVSELRKDIRIPIAVHCHDDMGLAVANTLSALEAGASICHVTVNGIGERAGNASLEEVAVNLNAHYGCDCLRLSKITETSDLVQRVTGVQMAVNKALVGSNAFAHSSGIHVHGMMENPLTYEPFKPEVIGAESHFVIGKLSGAHSIENRLEELGINFPPQCMDELMATIKRIAVGGKTITDPELIAIADDVMWKKSDQRKECILDELTVITGKSTTPTATVKITRVDGTQVTVSDIGVGPVNAAVNAIRKAVNEDMTMEEYRMSAITGQSDSICQVAVTLKNVQSDGEMTYGRAIGTDVVEASVEATMSAINKDFARMKPTRRS